MAAGNRPWLIYALGGGWGHLTRAASLAKAGEAHHRIRILTNSPYAMRVAKAMPKLDLISVDPSIDAEKARSQAVHEIVASDCGCLIVDTFPRGLGGELAGLLGSLKVTKVLIHRDLNPRYVAEAGLRAFVRSTYDLVLIPGESEAGDFADLPAAVITRPWLIRDPQPNRRHGGKPRILVCASGETGELPWYGAVVGCLQAHRPRVDIVCVATTCPPGCPPECWVEHWPAVDLYPEADVVVGGAGYNTIHECAAYQVPLVARPWPRRYDRQWLRARRAAKRGMVTIIEKPEEAAEAAIRLLEQMPSLRPIVDFRNGATEALTLIDQEGDVHQLHS
jgi:predicted glycosyltransferase